jgi:ketosteroid isomerase-like protein
MAHSDKAIVESLIKKLEAAHNSNKVEVILDLITDDCLYTDHG